MKAKFELGTRIRGLPQNKPRSYTTPFMFYPAAIPGTRYSIELPCRSYLCYPPPPMTRHELFTTARMPSFI